MLNWKTISENYPQAYFGLKAWIRDAFNPDAVVLEMVDGNGNPSDSHLKIHLTRIIPAAIRRLKKGEPRPEPQIIERDVFFQMRELFEFFDDQQITISTQPTFQAMVEGGKEKRMFDVFIFYDGNKVFPSNINMFGIGFGERRKAEMFAFEKAFAILESTMNFNSEISMNNDGMGDHNN